MRKLVYYVAVTLDGYIAGPNGEFDFLVFDHPEFSKAILTEFPETMPTVAREPLGVADTPNQRFDTVVMGRGTYEPGLAAGTTSPYAHLRQYVVSTTQEALNPEVTYVREDPVGLVRELKAEDGLDIWLCGGGRLAATLRDEIDELILKRNPFVLGAGIPLFDGPFSTARFTPTTTEPFDGGPTITRYTKP